MKKQPSIVIKVIIIIDYDPLNIVGNYECTDINKLKTGEDQIVAKVSVCPHKILNNYKRKIVIIMEETGRYQFNQVIKVNIIGNVTNQNYIPSLRMH